MSVSSSEDPVQTIVDLLDAATNAEWPSSTPPDRIERKEDSKPSQRQKDTRRSQVSLYVWSPVEANRVKWSAEGEADVTEGVRVQVMTNDAATSNNYASAVIDILDDYTNDNQTETAWIDIWPDGVDDATSQNFYNGGFAPIGVLVELRGYNGEPA